MDLSHKRRVSRALRALMSPAIIAIALVASAAAQDVAPDQAGAETEADETELFRPDLNTSIPAENVLKIVRNLAASGAYAEAGGRLTDLVVENPRAVSPWADGFYLPLWRVAVEEIAAWPAEGRRAWRATVRADAEQRWAAALRSGDLLQFEGVAHNFFLTDAGGRAAVALADRLRESGMPALALFYYRLVLDRHSGAGIGRDELLVRAALAAREAGIDRRATVIEAQLGEATIRPSPDGPSAPAAEWVKRQAAEPFASDELAGGKGNRSSSPAVAAATVTWRADVAAVNRRQVNVFQMMGGKASTPPIYPTISGDVVYVANLHSAWAVDGRTGQVLWRYDTRETRGESLPPPGTAQARQPLAADGVVYVPLEAPPPEDQNAQQRMGMLMGTSAETDLYALDAASGQPLWRWSPRDGSLEFGGLSVEGQPVLSGDLLLVPLASPSNFFGEVHVAALDRRDGRLRWSALLASYLANFGGAQRGWRLQSDVAGTALAARGGLLLSSSVGVTSAQSCLSGTVLWARVMPDMKLIVSSTRQFVVSRQPQLVEGMVLARRPRVLADRGIVVAGFALSPTLWAYDWIDGSILWQQEAAGARQPLALRGDAAIAWGQTVMVFDLQTGEPRRPNNTWPERIVGEPVVAAESVLAPTASGVTTMDLATGRIASTTELPPDAPSGNLALGPNGLVIASDSSVACLLDWGTAKSRFLAMAEQDLSDAAPLVTLGAAALRLDKGEEGLGYLDRALERDPSGADRAKLYLLFEGFYRQMSMRSDDALIERLLDRLAESAGGPAATCRQAFLRAEFLSRRDPRAAVTTLQAMLDDPSTRSVRIEGPAGPGVSGILAEEAIGRLINLHGAELYRPWEEAADAMRRRALAADDYAALLAVALRYPNSRASRKALDGAVLLLVERGDLDEADRLLLRLVNMTHEGDRETRYRALLAQTSLRVGSQEFAALQADALRRTAAEETAVPRLDGGETTVGEVLAAVAGAATGPPPEAAPQTLAGPPYRMVWRAELPPELLGLRPINALGEFARPEPDKQGSDFIFLWHHQRMVALDRDSGRMVWDTQTATDPRDPVRRCFIGQTGLYASGTGWLARFLPTTGETMWHIRLQPESGRSIFAPRESVTGVMLYGDSSWKTGSKVYADRFEEIGDKLVVNTRFNLHVVDPRDGYTVQTVGYPYGVFYSGFIRWGHTAMSIPTAPVRMQDRLLFHDLATGDFDEEIRLGRRPMPSAIAQHGSRWWPLFLDGGREVMIVDLATRRITPSADMEAGNPRWQMRQGLAEGDVLYAHAARGTGVQAFDLAQQTVLWTFDPPEDQQVRAMQSHGENLLVSWQDGLAMVRKVDGTAVWQKRFEDGKINAVQPAAVVGDRMVATVHGQFDNQWRSFTVLLDSRTGEQLFQFDREGAQRTELLAIDESSILVRTNTDRQPELWVHDPDGEWK